MPTDPFPAFSDILHAARVIRGEADQTPLIPSPFLSARTGQDILLKLEIAQPIGAFKLRGAMNALAALPAETEGIVCCSTGNHGRAIAYAARRAGLRAVVCMSELVPSAKVEAIRALGAEIRIFGHSQDEASEETRRLACADGLTEVPPFDDVHVIAGQGTIGLELLSARPDLETILVPLSGGGLAAGVALAAKTMRPSLRVVGISMERGAAMKSAFDAGQPVEVEEHPSLADSLGGGIGLANRLTLPLCRQLLDEVVLVSEAEIRDAMQAHFFEDRLVVEGAGAVGAAAILAGKVRPAGPAATILTGRNTDMSDFAALMTGRDLRLGDFTLEGRTYGA